MSKFKMNQTVRVREEHKHFARMTGTVEWIGGDGTRTFYMVHLPELEEEDDQPFIDEEYLEEVQ